MNAKHLYLSVQVATKKRSRQCTRLSPLPPNVDPRYRLWLYLKGWSPALTRGFSPRSPVSSNINDRQTRTYVHLKYIAFAEFYDLRCGLPRRL